MALFTRQSRATGAFHVIKIPITHEQWRDHVKSGKLIQNSFPQLTPEQREFLISGTTQEEWDELFKEED